MAIPEQPERIDDLRTRVAKSRLASAVLEVVRGKAIAEVAKRYGLSPRELGHAEKIALEAILGASEPTASGHWLVADTDLLVSGFNFGYPFCPEPKVLIDRVIPMAAIRTSTRLRRNKWGMTLGLKA